MGIFDIDSGADNHLLNEQFHVFSKSPASVATALGDASNRSGHTVTASDVWGQEIPAFFYAKTQAVADSYKSLAKTNDLCRIGNSVAIFENGNWVVKYNSYTDIPDGHKFKNANGDEVIRFHKNRLAYNLNLDNNAADDGLNTTAKIQGWDDENGKVYDYVATAPKFVTQFVTSTDKIVDGIPSKGFGPFVMADTTTGDITKVLPEGTSDSNHYIANSFAGIIQFNKARTDAIYVHAFEYCGKTLKSAYSDIVELDEKLSKISVTASGGVQDASTDAKAAGLSVTAEKRTDADGKEETIPVITIETGSVTADETKLVTGSAVKTYVDTTALTEGGSINTAIKNAIDAIPEISTVNSANQLGINGHVIEVKRSTFTAQTGTSTSIGTMTANENGLATGATVIAVANDALRAAKAYSNSLHTTSVTYHVTDTLPTVPAGKEEEYKGRIYLVLRGIDGVTAADGDRIEYMYVQENDVWGWEQIGTTNADLSGYAKTADVTTAIATATQTTTLVSEEGVLTAPATDDEKKFVTASGIYTAINTAINALDAEESVNGIIVTQENGKITEIKEELITASVPEYTTSVEGNVAYVGSEKHVIAPEKFHAIAMMPSTLTSWGADLPNIKVGIVDNTSDGMFRETTNMTSFVGDLSSLTRGCSMFYGSIALSTFVSDLSSLEYGLGYTFDGTYVDGGSGMFSYTNLTTDSIECIADTLPEIVTDRTTGYGCISINWGADDKVETKDEETRKAYATALQEIADKGWSVYTNASVASLVDATKYDVTTDVVTPKTRDINTEPETITFFYKK